MALDPSIILAGRSPDLVGQFDRGQIAGQRQNQIGRENALAALYRDQGSGIANGDPQALNALAGLDPNMAMKVQSDRLGMDSTRLGMKATQFNMDRLTREEQRQVEEHALKLSADERAQTAAKIEDSVRMGMAVQSPQEWDALMTSQGRQDLVGQFDARQAIAAKYMTMAEVIAQTKGADPAKGAPQGYTWTQPGNPTAGVTPLPGYVQKSDVTINNNPDGNSGAFAKKADEAAAARFDGIVQEGRSAQAMLGDLASLAALAPKVGTGAGAELKVALGPYADAMGIDVGNLSEAQAYKAIIDRLAPNMRPAGAGATSDFDAKQFLSALPNLGRTPEGNAMITATLQAVQENKIKAADIANKAFSNEITWQEADKQIAALANPYEQFKAQRKDGIGTAGPTVIDGFSIEEIK